MNRVWFVVAVDEAVSQYPVTQVFTTLHTVMYFYFILLHSTQLPYYLLTLLRYLTLLLHQTLLTLPPATGPFYFLLHFTLLHRCITAFHTVTHFYCIPNNAFFRGVSSGEVTLLADQTTNSSRTSTIVQFHFECYQKSAIYCFSLSRWLNGL
jgi:hypothetical protein